MVGVLGDRGDGDPVPAALRGKVVDQRLDLAVGRVTALSWHPSQAHPKRDRVHVIRLAVRPDYVVLPSRLDLPVEGPFIRGPVLPVTVQDHGVVTDVAPSAFQMPLAEGGGIAPFGCGTVDYNCLWFHIVLLKMVTPHSVLLIGFKKNRLINDRGLCTDLTP